MSDLALLTLAAAATAGFGIISGVLLKAWYGWLKIRQAELGSDASAGRGMAGNPELASLKQRVRKLEAIASGVDY